MAQNISFPTSNMHLPAPISLFRPAVFTVFSIGGGNVKIKSTIISKLGHYHLEDVWFNEIHVQKRIF